MRWKPKLGHRCMTFVIVTGHMMRSELFKVNVKGDLQVSHLSNNFATIQSVVTIDGTGRRTCFDVVT